MQTTINVARADLSNVHYGIQFPNSLFSDSVVSVFNYDAQFNFFYYLVALFD